MDNMDVMDVMDSMDLTHWIARSRVDRDHKAHIVSTVLDNRPKKQPLFLC